MARPPMRWIALFSLMFVGCATEDIALGSRTSDSGAPDVAFQLPEVSPPTDADPEEVSITNAVVSATLEEVSLKQSCVPPVASDPLRATMKLVVENLSDVSAGELRASKGRILRDGAVVATFAVAPVVFTLTPRGSFTATIEKSAGSLEPKSGCDTLPCGSEVDLEIELTGPTPPPRASVLGATVECAP